MADDHDIALAVERRRAIRALLAQPLLYPDHEDFSLIRRHADWLKSWFGQFLGYRLVVEAGFARLVKAGLPRGAGRPLLRSTGPFTPRSYAYLALTVSVLLACPEQLLLSQLIADVRSAAVEAGIELGDVGRPVERRAFAAALRQLVRWRVLVEEQGTVDGYTDHADTEALLTVDRDVVTHLLAAPMGRASTPEEFLANAAGAGPGGARHTVRRRLLECPVVYLDDLTARERAWLRREQRRDERSFGEYVGLQAELRAEGAALFDPDEELTDLHFPGTGTVAQAALLALEALVVQLSPATSRVVPPVIGVPVPDGALEAILAGLVERHRRRWAAAYTDDLPVLREAVVDMLTRMGLLARAGPTLADTESDEDVAAERGVDARAARGDGPSGTLVLLAAAARYAAVERTGEE